MLTTRRVTLVEDDKNQAPLVVDLIKLNFPGTEVDRIETESEFRCRFESIAASQPAAIVLDVLVKWTRRGRSMEPMPPEVEMDDGVWKAGLRCLDMLLRDPRTRLAPIFLCTALSEAALIDRLRPWPPNVRYVGKQSCSELIEALRDVLSIDPFTRVH